MMSSRARLRELLVTSEPLEVLGELLEAVFHALAHDVEQALELLILTEYIQAQLILCHGEELRMLRLPDHALSEESSL